MRVLRTDTGSALARGEVSCSLSVGGSRIEAGSAGFGGERARFVVTIPAGTTGRRLRATIESLRGTVVKRSVSGRVR